MAKYVEVSNTVKKDDCNDLKCLYCRVENCGFYKSNSKYHADGRLK